MSIKVAVKVVFGMYIQDLFASSVLTKLKITNEKSISFNHKGFVVFVGSAL